MKYFGTDGIRGILGDDLSYSLIIRLANSLSLFNINKVYIGYDTRETSKVIKEIFALGLANKIEAIDIGIMSTPAIMYLAKIDNCIGIAITASHNPYYYNGIKLIINGTKPNEKQIASITNYLDNNKPIVYFNKLKKQSLMDNYISYLSKYKTKINLNAIIDCANGALYKAAKIIFNDIFTNVIFLGCSPNGRNINEGCGAVSLNNLKKKTKELQYDIGIAFDGDGDRLIIIDKNGNEINGDIICYILAKYFKYKYNINSVCLTKIADLGIAKEFEKLGLNVFKSDVGDSNLLKMMLDNNITLGSEASGHIIPLLYTNIGDGLLNALLFINAIKELNIKVDEIYNSIHSYYTKTINIPFYENYSPNMFDNIIAKYKKAYKDDFMLIFRKSGTEKLLRLTISMKNKLEAENVFSECLKLLE